MFLLCPSLIIHHSSFIMNNPDDYDDEYEDELCYSGEPPAYCSGLPWFYTLPLQCVNCLDYKIQHEMYQFYHKNTSPVVASSRRHLLRIFDDNPNLGYVFPGFVILVFMLSQGMQPPPTIRLPGTDEPSLILSGGNGFFFRYILAVAIGYVLLNVYMMFYFSHGPNRTEGVVHAYDMVTPPVSTVGDEIRTLGRIHGWKNDNNGTYDLLVGALLVAIVTLFLQRFASGLELKGGALYFFYIVLFVLAGYVIFERVAITADMWPSDVLVLGGVSLLSGIVALSYHAAFVSVVTRYQDSVAVYKQSEEAGDAWYVRYGIIIKDYIIYLLVLAIFVLSAAATYYLHLMTRRGADEFLIPDQNNIGNFVVYVGEDAIRNSRRTRRPGIRVGCGSMNRIRKTVTLAPGSFYRYGSESEQINKLCAEPIPTEAPSMTPAQ